MKYFNGLETKQDIANNFSIDVESLENCNIVFAAYTYEDYSGSALVLYEEDGKLYEVNGSHCSCYGLEGQWSPEETTLEALRMRDHENLYGFQGNLASLFVDAIFEKDVLLN
jgi:hypothetical protein